MSLRVTVLSERGSGATAKGLGAWLGRAAPAKARGHVTVAIVPDATMKALNKRFRCVDRATDVLSFPADAGSKRTRSTYTRSGSRQYVGRVLLDPPLLGDIVIARGVAARQARALGHPLRMEVRILALHGLLHLLGYDHEVDSGQMAKLEGRLRRRAGLPDGLIARSS